MQVCRTEEATPSPFPDLPAGVLEMRVKEGSKIHNLMGFALARVQGEQGTGGGVRQLVFVGSGRAVTKTITCAEILKRRVEGLHQLTKVQQKMVHEVWEGSQDGAAKAGVTVHRTVPAISILLSKDPLDPQEPGYQPPLAPGVGWAPPSKREDENRDITQPASKRLPDALPHQPSSKKPHL
uniref:Ribonuclease P and MRP subunit p25 n=1 Tax=Paramormyrops kingsleyae TaxID=1676925 RepID=A0A3B3RKA2_9TELE